MEKVTIQFDADLSPLQDKLGQLKSSGLEQLSTGANEASSSIDKLSQSAKNMPMNVISQGFDEATTSIKENSQAITENVNKQQSMKAELRDLKNRLQELEDQGKDNTKEFEQMAIRAGQLSDQIGDTSARIKVLGDDSKYIKAVSQAIGAMASAYSVAQGASALFGNENKDVEKALLKVNAAMSIANGLQQINEALQKQSTIAVVAHSTAQKLYNYFVVEGTVATRGFRIALASTGIGLAVVALGFLYEAYQEHNKAVKKAAVETIGFGEAMQNSLGDASKEIANLEVLYKTATDASKSMTDRKEAVKELQKLYPSYFANLSQEAILNGKAKDSYTELNNAILDNARARAYTSMLEDQITKQEKNLETQRETLNFLKERLETLKQSRAEIERSGASVTGINQQIKDSEAGILKLQTAYNKTITANEDANKKLIDEVVKYTDKSAKYQADVSGQSADKQKQDAKDANQAIIDFYQIRINTAKQALDVTEKGTKAELDAQIALQYATSQLAIKQVELSTDSEALKKSKIQTINADMYAAMKLLMQSFDKAQEDSVNKQVKTTKDGTEKQLDEIDEIVKKWREESDAAEEAYNNNKAQKEADQRKANRQAALNSLVESAQTIANAEFEIDKANRDAKLQADIDALEQRKENELKNKNLTEAQKLAIQTKYDKLEAEAKKKAWEAEQDAKKKQAIINGALAITNIWATYGGTNPVLAGILTAASIISTATQVRVIDSQPVPKFAKGKNLDGYEGMAIIGEAGRELRLDSDGSMKMYNRATLDHVNADSIILPNNLTEALLKTNIPAMNLRNMNAVTKQNISAKLDIDYKKLARTLGEELKNSQKVSVNIDEKGFETRIMNGISERRVIDNRYKL